MLLLLAALLALSAAAAWFAFACTRAEARAAGEPDPVPEHLARTAWQRGLHAAEQVAARVPVPARRRTQHAAAPHGPDAS